MFALHGCVQKCIAWSQVYLSIMLFGTAFFPVKYLSSVRKCLKRYRGIAVSNVLSLSLPLSEKNNKITRVALS